MEFSEFIKNNKLDEESESPTNTTDKVSNPDVKLFDKPIKRKGYKNDKTNC